MRPHRQQPTRLQRPWDSPGKNTGVGCHFLLQCMKVKSESEVTQSCPTLSDPMDCSLPASSIHGILQARVLEWGAIAFSSMRTYVIWPSLPQPPPTSYPPASNLDSGPQPCSATFSFLKTPCSYLPTPGLCTGCSLFPLECLLPLQVFT